MKIGDAVKKARKDKKLTLTELSHIAGVTVSFISDIENGKKQPSLETLERLSKALSVPLYSFFGERMHTSSKKDSQDSVPDSFIEQARALFMSDELSREDKEAIFKDITDLYWKCRGYTKE